MSTVGVPAEVAEGEQRVALVPPTVAKLVAAEWTVMIESGAGAAAGFPDAQYSRAGAEVTDRATVLGADVVLGV
ncbi:MAG: NAD(P)(+) transhydrogenase (Re/Si-specific) subunit alpha, partial [Acidimicrobiia bacterium]|nr:NAD(P)(+) transhydrogenase (Re/Si-specific) subunit alpha [Acidimicrobiia bacterium]